jgi:Extensin-like protein C-terminus
MARRVSPVLLGFCVLISLSGCGFLEHAERPAWRTQAENACLARGLVQPSAFITSVHEIDGPGICGLTHPFKVSGLVNGTVLVEGPVTIDCSMVPALEDWLAQVVQPAAQAHFGVPVVGLTAFGAYSCRSVDNIAGAQLSEHSFGNAIDISGFKLADGRTIVIVQDWKKTDTQESAFLHEAHAGACQHFTTVLGPGADVFHYNHFHLDLAMHGATNTGPRRYCKPTPSPALTPPPLPSDGLPAAPAVEEPMDIAQVGSGSSGPMLLHAPTGELPPAPVYPAYNAAPPSIQHSPSTEGRPKDWDITSSIRMSQDD